MVYQFLEAALFWDRSASFWFFLLIINGKPDGIVFVLPNEKRLQSQVYGQSKSRLKDTSGSCKSSLFERVDFSLFIFHLHFLNLDNIVTLPKFSLSLKLRLIWHDLYLPCFLRARFTRMRAGLRNQSRLLVQTIMEKMESNR